MSTTSIYQNRQQSSSSSVQQCRERSTEERLHIYNNLTKFIESVQLVFLRNCFYLYCVTLDIIHRLLKNYFGYDVCYYVNIDDSVDLADEKSSKSKGAYDCGACETKGIII
ncbi:unnamed protein product [Adineta steineri]|uniref:Uncharacterized protein n=1 Tax=Adineta steineri TaxID=433720 RepID=A0A819YJV7_9BILA|nr:unnamed protein product [Adineta steineri]CAF4158734.1 unnamed protein product [Adineta steineri]